MVAYNCGYRIFIVSYFLAYNRWVSTGRKMEKVGFQIMYTNIFHKNVKLEREILKKHEISD